MLKSSRAVNRAVLGTATRLRLVERDCRPGEGLTSNAAPDCPVRRPARRPSTTGPVPWLRGLRDGGRSQQSEPSCHRETRRRSSAERDGYSGSSAMTYEANSGHQVIIADCDDLLGLVACVLVQAAARIDDPFARALYTHVAVVGNGRGDVLAPETGRGQFVGQLVRSRARVDGSVAAFPDLHVLRHRLPTFLGEAFGGSTSLINVGVDDDSDDQALRPDDRVTQSFLNHPLATRRATVKTVRGKHHAVAQVARFDNGIGAFLKVSPPFFKEAADRRRTLKGSGPRLPHDIRVEDAHRPVDRVDITGACNGGCPPPSLHEVGYVDSSAMTEVSPLPRRGESAADLRSRSTVSVDPLAILAPRARGWMGARSRREGQCRARGRPDDIPRRSSAG